MVSDLVYIDSVYCQNIHSVVLYHQIKGTNSWEVVYIYSGLDENRGTMHRPK